MKKILLAITLLVVVTTHAQLTVEKIMADTRWMGTSPSNVFWSSDNKTVFFNWNPQKNISDSLYSYTVGATAPQKANPWDIAKINAINNGVYNFAGTQMVYVFRGDLYWVDIKTNKTLRITQTEEFESSPKFIMNDEWIVYSKNNNLYGWHTKTGITLQLTNITRSAETVANTAFAGGRGGGGGNFQRPPGAPPAGGANTASTQTQDGWLQQQQLSIFQVLKERKDKREKRDAFNKTAPKYNDTLRTIGIGEKILQGLQISPDARFITYRLFQPPPTSGKNTIVPDYVTESGYTTDIPGRTKVGNPLGKSDFYVWDKQKDTLILVTVDSIPGITDLPDYAKDYPKKYEGKKAPVRGVNINGPYWNDAGTFAIVDIRSQDNKDRWIMQLDAASGKLILLDRQRDNAWIGGPGVGAFGAKIGWINNTSFYFQSEATGYSHLYVYDINTNTKKALTSGNYELQDLALSKNKQYWYLLTNETHPGKQHWYRMKLDGSAKERITSMDGGYEVSMSGDEKWIAYRYSYINKPWELYIQENAPGKKPQQVTTMAMSEEFKAYPWKEAKVVGIPARDGATIYARIYEPAADKKNGAAVFFVHGAGYLQNVHYWWSSYFREYMFNNLLADKGYTVVDIDYRASSGYGRDWRTGIYRHMGGKDLTDHVDAADYLVKNYGIDPARIGLYGGSYGGFITVEIYVNGFSTSLPEEVQNEALRQVPGFENVRIFRPGYAIEYDYFMPTQLTHALETKLVSNLFFAGQINGTTGYEEAACQGLIAGINAHQKVSHKEPFVLKRSEAYMGVLVDDLINKGTDEPYRMFTSRAEFRTLLRQDNADLRLTKKSYDLGLASKERIDQVERKTQEVALVKNILIESSIDPEDINSYFETIQSAALTEKQKAAKIILRPNVSLTALKDAIPSLAEKLNNIPSESIEQAEIQIKYERYIEKEYQLVEKMSELEHMRIPANFDYKKLSALSNEAVQKLSKIKPETLGQASRISGVNPSDVQILMVYMGR